MTRSAWVICHGDFGAVRTVYMFMPATVVDASARTESRSGADIRAPRFRKRHCAPLCAQLFDRRM